MKHRWGCACAECSGRGAARLREAQAVREHNRAAVGRAYYATGPRVPPASAACDMYVRFDWQMTPKPGELEYLGEVRSHHERGTVPNMPGRW